MKKPIILLLCIIIAASILTVCFGGFSSHSHNSSFDVEKINTMAVEGNSMFAFDIFKQLSKEDKNQSIFISPLSISTALAMTYQGAETTTKEVMAKTLGYTDIDRETLNESYRNLIRYLKQLDDKIDLNIGNSLWIREGESIKEDFIATNKDIFDASVTSLDFSKPNAADQINEWISNTTKKKIEKMVDSPIPPSVVMYLINAIYFTGDWAEQFDQESTFSTQFYSGDGSISEIMMMSKSGKAEYGQGDVFKAIRLPYGSGKTAMYCILPEKTVSINDFIAGLDKEMWRAIKESIGEENEVQLQLPRFKLEYGIKNLNESLTALGMGEAFTGAADFSGICDGIYINRVLHKAVIEVNENGSEAAAGTVVEMYKTSVQDPLAFIANRPFVFIIADDETNTILFMGKLSDVK